MLWDAAPNSDSQAMSLSLHISMSTSPLDRGTLSTQTGSSTGNLCLPYHLTLLTVVMIEELSTWAQGSLKRPVKATFVCTEYILYTSHLKLKRTAHSPANLSGVAPRSFIWVWACCIYFGVLVSSEQNENLKETCKGIWVSSAPGILQNICFSWQNYLSESKWSHRCLQE